MRTIDKEGALYLAAKEAARSLITCLREELEPFLFQFVETRGNETSYLGICYEMPHLNEGNVYYGREDGLYLIVCSGEGFVWLPKSSDAYHKLLMSMAYLYEDDEELRDKNLMDDIDIEFDGDNTAKYTFYGYVFDRKDKAEYNSSKQIATEVMEMVKDMEELTDVTLYEGDDSGDTSEEKEHANYYVGFKFTCNAFLR
jgi:hypothetical protein